MIDGQEQSFGTNDIRFSTKKAARQNAARLAVEQLKSIGLWPETDNSRTIKKKKISPDGSTSSTPVPASNVSAFSTPASPSNVASCAQQLAVLAAKLKLGTPQYELSRVQNQSDWYQASCTFSFPGPNAGPHVGTGNFFGKKKAKEDCARQALRYLHALSDHRTTQAREMTADLKGNEDVLPGALRRELEGEAAAVSLAMEHNAEDSDEFQDAMQEQAGGTALHGQ